MNKATYDEYLQSPAWKTRRNTALKSAGWRCSRCGRKRHLQVHHRSYERVGQEHDGDLEVLCEDCHSQHHIADMHNADTGRVYLRLASEALRDDAWATLSDLADDVKRRCIALHIVPYDTAAIDRALALLSASGRVKTSPPSRAQVIADMREGRPLTHAESREFLARLFAGGGRPIIKTIPSASSSIDIYGPPPETPDEYTYEVF